VAVKNPDGETNDRLVRSGGGTGYRLSYGRIRSFRVRRASPDPSTRTASERFRRPLRDLESHGRSLL
jgi:hypothetical protein